MSSNVSSPSNQKSPGNTTPSPSKGKAKASDKPKNVVHQEDEEDQDEDEDDDADADEDMKSDIEDSEEEEDQFEEIDPSAIQSRRTRGIRIDYTSKEALEKAGLSEEGADDEDEDMKD